MPTYSKHQIEDPEIDHAEHVIKNLEIMASSQWNAIQYISNLWKNLDWPEYNFTHIHAARNALHSELNGLEIQIKAARKHLREISQKESYR